MVHANYVPVCLSMRGNSRMFVYFSGALPLILICAVTVRFILCNNPYTVSDELTVYILVCSYAQYTVVPSLNYLCTATRSSGRM